MALGLLYMHTVLYWLRVHMGLPVPCVYGFAVCGPKCRDVDEKVYVVVLLKVSVPEILGDTFLYEYHQLNSTSLTDERPIRTLIQFLRLGSRSMGNLGASHSLPIEHRAPAYFALPTKYWDSSASQEYELVRGGTVAIVFKATWKGVNLLLDHPAYSSWHRDMGFRIFRLSEATNSFFRFGGKPFPYVVKFQLIGVSNGTSEDFSLLARHELPADLRETYPIEGIPASFKNGKSHCFVMVNRGERVDKASFARFCDIRTAFQCVWNTAIELCKTVPPCDTLVHNMVYDGRSLHLIDVDEGNDHREPIKERIVDEELSEELKEEMRFIYPQCLRNLHKQYAVVQLAVSYTHIAFLNANTTTGALEDVGFVDFLRSLRTLKSAILDRKLLSMPFQSLPDMPDEMSTPLSEVSSAMEGWFGSST